MTFSLRFRKQVAVLAILITVMVATYLAAPRDGSRVRQIQGADLNQHSITRTIESLNQREVVHILAHVLIFGGIAFWLGAWGTPSGSVGLGWRYGMGGGILTEVAQTMVGIGSYTAMGLVAEWLETTTLHKLQPLLLQYFEEEGHDRWVFFHNSFPLFLQERTADWVPGRTTEEQNQAYHRELAEHYEASPTRWQWEALYHWYSAGEYEAVLETATQEWFREQVETLRPLDAIQSDARLALRAAGRCKDVTALARLTLVGAALEQRAWTLEDRLLPDLLLEAGKAALAAEHLRDGNRLRVEKEQALCLSPCLLEAGLRREARRVFELAEPLELLSGRPIPDDHTRPQNLWDLLREWAQSAVVFRGAEETAQVVRRIRIEPRRIDLRRHEGEDVEQASLRFQNWLLFQGAIACAKRGDWAEWQILFDAQDEERDRLNRFFTLLRSAKWVKEIDGTDRACTLLSQLLTTLQPAQLENIDEWRWWTEARLTVAELALWVASNEPAALRWTEDIPPIPLEDTESYREREPTLHELRFRRGRLCYLLGESCKPEALLREAEASTEFGEYVPEEKRAARRLIALGVFRLSRLWAWGRLGSRLTPNAFLQEVRWILDFFGPRWMTHSMSVRLAITEARTEVLRYVVVAAAEHGKEAVEALKEEFETRWIDPDEGTMWWSGLQREIILAFADVGAGQKWAKAQLSRIEPIILQNLELYGRVEACEAQAKAWLALGEPEEAVRQLRRMVKAARGILSEDDYQLFRWVRWLGRINELEPDQAEERTQLMLRRILSVEGIASGLGDAAEELLEVVFRLSPRRGVRLLKGLLERDIVGHQGGVTRLLTAALDVQEPPVKEVLHTAIDLILPLVPSAESGFLKTLVASVSDQLGHGTALEVTRDLVRRTGVDAPAHSRSGWYQGIVDGLHANGISSDQVGLQLSDLKHESRRGSSQVDEGIHLKSGEHLKPGEVLDRTRTVDDLRELLTAEDRESTRYFDWSAVIENLAQGIHSTTELREIEDLIEDRLSGESSNKHRLSQSLTALSKQWLKIDDCASAWALAEKALDATEASGWDPYFDGGARQAALRQLIAIDPDQGREIAIDLYGRDLSERFRYPGRVVLHLYDVLTLLSDEVPVAEIWPAIEDHLDDLFTAVLVEPQPAMEALLEESIETPGEDTPEQSVADLLVLYLAHPSYAVAQAAVRACTDALLDDSQAVTTALEGALSGTDQSIERALMVLDAASMENSSVIAPFEGTLRTLRLSPNFTVRLIASTVYARISDGVPTLPTVEREKPAIYTLHLPGLAFHRTEEILTQRESPVLVGDPAQMLRPLDIEARVIAEAAGVPEDNVLYRAVQHFRRLEKERKWLADDETLNPERLSIFLNQVGPKHAHYKPHIAPARQALAYVVAELYDGGYLAPDALRKLSRRLIHHDPAFIHWRPERRPECVSQIGGLPDDNYSHIRLPDDWLETVGDSLALLRSRTSDGWIIVGERTRLKRLQEAYPEEERLAMIRAVGKDSLWDGVDIEKGHPPFSRFLSAQASDYPYLQTTEDNLVVACDGRYFETTEVDWLAFNPIVGQALGWRPIPGPWFRWADQQDELVVKSIWWNDGPLYCANDHLSVEVGGGWLVLITELGFEKLRGWAGRLGRGGVAQRRLGWLGKAGQSQATSTLELS